MAVSWSENKIMDNRKEAGSFRFFFVKKQETDRNCKCIAKNMSVHGNGGGASKCAYFGKEGDFN